MRVLVCGSRYYNNYKELCRVLKAFDITEIIEGEARGADKLAERYAIDNGIPVQRYPADWNLHGKAAGAIRNTQMLKEGKPELVIAFMGPNSRGTKDMTEQAARSGIPVEIFPVWVEGA